MDITTNEVSNYETLFKNDIKKCIDKIRKNETKGIKITQCSFNSKHYNDAVQELRNDFIVYKYPYYCKQTSKKIVEVHV